MEGLEAQHKMFFIRDRLNKTWRSSPTEIPVLCRMCLRVYDSVRRLRTEPKWGGTQRTTTTTTTFYMASSVFQVLHRYHLVLILTTVLKSK